MRCTETRVTGRGTFLLVCAQLVVGERGFWPIRACVDFGACLLCLNHDYNVLGVMISYTYQCLSDCLRPSLDYL